MKPIKHSTREKGQSLTELAIGFPVILLLILGTIDFGMAIYSYMMLRDAVQEGALYGSIDPNNRDEIESRARNIFPVEEGALSFIPVDLLDPDIVSIKITTSGENCQGIVNGKINSITVNASYNYPIMMPFGGTILGSKTIKLDTSATNVILQPACK